MDYFLGSLLIVPYNLAPAGGHCATDSSCPSHNTQRCFRCGEGIGLLEKGLGCTLPESQQEGGLSVGAGGPQGASRWRDYRRRSAHARSFAA